jgi:hypothetical protein
MTTVLLTQFKPVPVFKVEMTTLTSKQLKAVSFFSRNDHCGAAPKNFGAKISTFFVLTLIGSSG